MIHGAAIGSRLRSEVSQFIWIEYSSRVAMRFTIAMLLFTALIVAAFYFLEPSLAPALQILLIAATLGSLLLTMLSIRSAIAQLDDVLRAVQMNALAIGFVLTLFIVMAFALINQVYPIPSSWLVTSLIMFTAFLVGRFVTAWKYR